MTTVSIALCTYNGAAFLDEQLASYLSQTRPPDELVVCDDGSTDDTLAILTRYAGTAPFPVRVYRNEHQLGIVQNFEKATQLCECDIIFFSDQDDVWYDTKIERMTALFDARPDISAVFCNAELVDGHLQPIGTTLWQHFKFSEALQRRVLAGTGTEGLLINHYMWGMSLAFRANIRDLCLPFGEMGHDLWIGKITAAMGKLTILPEPLLKYRRHPGNTTNVINVFSRGEKMASVAHLLVKKRRMTRRQAYTQRVERLQQLRDHLAELASRDLPSRAQLVTSIRFLDGLISHLQARARLPSTRPYRVPGALRELVTLHYRRYSNGVRGFARDLVEKDAPRQ